MAVHPQIAAILAADEPASLSAEEARAAFERSALTYAGEPVAVAEVSDVAPGRLYVPEGAVGALLWMHGGGWVVGSLDAFDPLCRSLAVATGAAVLSVDYRLAPETQFPGALEDCFEALGWLMARFPGAPLAVGGDSAGANLAAVVARRARDAGVPDLRFQLLIYPPVDAACATGSMWEYGGGEYRLSREEMLWCWEQYAPGASQRSPDASALRAASLDGLPPALLLFAEYDPLTDEGLDYAERLQAAGVTAETRIFPGMVHGFFRWQGAVDAAREALDVAGAAVRTALRGAAA